jgi:transposase
MPGPYSLDLRKRIIASHKQGAPCRQVGDVYGISPSCAAKLAARERQTGSIEPDTLGRPRGSGKLEPYREFDRVPSGGVTVPVRSVATLSGRSVSG